MKYPDIFLNLEIMQVLGWTLVCTIWQITFIGILLKFSLFLLRRSTANLRFIFACSAMVIILFMSVYTFWKINTHVAGALHAENNIVYHFSMKDQQLSPFLKPSEYSKSNLPQGFFPASAFGFIDQNIVSIVGLWLLGLVLFSVRLSGSFLYVYRLRIKYTRPAEKQMVQVVNELKRKLNIDKAVAVAETFATRIPMVLGHFRPMVLIPVGLAISLPYDQLEAIILHELTHIKRRDYLINLLKSLLEVIFFYHPVFWWISRVIDEERENCCDDITVKTCGNAQSLRNALLNMEEFNQKPTYIAAALFKNNHQLLKRIKRMKTNNQTIPKFKGNLTGLFLLITGGVVIASFTAFAPRFSNDSKNHQFPETLFAGSNIAADLSGTENSLGKITVTTTVNSVKSIPKTVRLMEQKPDTVDKEAQEKGEIKLVLDKNGNLLRATRDGKELSADESAQYEHMLQEFKVLKEEEKQLDQTKEKLDKTQDELKAAREKIKQAQEEYNEALKSYMRTLSENLDHHALGIWTLADENLAKALILSKSDIDIDIDSNLIWDNYENLIEIKEFELQDELNLMELEIDRQIDLLGDDILLQDLKMDLIEDQLVLQLEDMEELKFIELKASTLEDNIKSELVKDKIIRNEDDLKSFQLSNKKLEVNGKKLSNELHEKYLNLCEELLDDKFDDDKKIIILK